MFGFKKKSANQPSGDSELLIERGYRLFEEFRQAYVLEWARQDWNEKLYRGEHWDAVPVRDAKEPRPMTPIIQSTVENVQADLMGSFPQSVIRPESPADMDVAEVVGALIKQNHDAQNFKSDYRKMAHDLLVQGWCVSESGFDTHAYNNIGMAYIRYVNCRTILFDPQVEDIQDGRAVFKVQPVTIERLEQMYPQYKDKFAPDEYTVTLEGDQLVRNDKAKNVLLLEYWFREYENGMFRVHMVKLAGRNILEDSRETKPEGYFSAGTYPFVVTTLLRRKGSPLGIGFADSFGKQQIYADKLDQIVLKNALMASHNKLLVTEASGFDVNDLQDWAKEVHRGESLNGVTWFSTPPLPAYIMEHIARIRQGVKDESGANDFSRGTTASGVTAASAIAALQEMASKRSTMINGQLQEAYKEAVRMEIEFEREYNMFPREVLVTRRGQQQSMTFDAAMMSRDNGNGISVPIEFFVSIKTETERKWQTNTQNELVLQLLQMQVLTPQQAVEHMVFDGKDEILKDMADQQSGQMPSPEQAAHEEAAAQQQAMAEQLQQMPTPDGVA